MIYFLVYVIFSDVDATISSKKVRFSVNTSLLSNVSRNGYFFSVEISRGEFI